MSKVDTALNLFKDYNCAQSVATAYAGDYGLDKDRALQVSVGFGGGMGRVQDVCGAISGAIIALGLASAFKEGDGRDKTNAVYAKVHGLIDEFAARKGTIKCRELLGCDLTSEEGHAFFVEHKLREKNCQDYIRLCCELLDKYLKAD